MATPPALRRLRWIDWLLTRAESYGALLEQWGLRPSAWDIGNLAWFLFSAAGSALLGVWAILADASAPIGITVGLAAFLCLQGFSILRRLASANQPNNPTTRSVMEIQGDQITKAKQDAVPGRLDRLEQKLENSLKEIRDRIEDVRGEANQRLRDREIRRKIDHLHSQLLDEAARLDWPRERPGTSEEWDHWKREYRAYLQKIRTVCNLALPYYPEAFNILRTYPDSYRPVHWNLPKDHFPDENTLHDFKEFRLIRATYWDASEDILSILDTKCGS